MKNINTTKTLIKSTLSDDMFHRYKVVLKDGYLLSILTGSHFNSAKLQTVEVALKHNNDFVFGDDDSDASIIHYMTWSLFLDFIGDMNSINEGKLDKTFEEVFRQYQGWAYEM